METKNNLITDLLTEFEKGKESTFEESFNGGFFPISFTKTDEGYYVNCITSDIQYDFRILGNGKINKGSRLNFQGNDFENYLEIEQSIIKMGGIQSMGQQSNPDLRIIPIEKIKKLDLNSLEEYLRQLNKDIEENLDEYKRRVQEIWENGSKDL